jgi:transcription antitermination factor NusG
MPTKWYAVLTKVRRELLAVNNLRAQGYETFYPFHRYTIERIHRKPREATRAYLPRYIFVGLNGHPKHSIYGVNNTIGVSTVVYCGHEALPIPGGLITELRSRAKPDGEVYPDEKPPAPEFDGKPGEYVKFVENSPLFGFVACIKAIDKNGKLSLQIERMLGANREIIANSSDVSEIIGLDGSLRPAWASLAA